MTRTYTHIHVYICGCICMHVSWLHEQYVGLSVIYLYNHLYICEYWVAFAFHFQLCFFVGFFLFCAFCFVTSCELQIRNRVESVAVSLLHIAYVWVRCVPCYDVLIEALEWLYWNCNIWQKSNSWFKYIAKHSQWRLTIHIFIDI